MYTFTNKIYNVFFQKNIHTLSDNNTRFFVLPLSNSENHEYMKYFWNIYYFVTIYNKDQARVPRKPISANRGLNLVNHGIHFVPRFDPVPESMINLNLGIN